MTSQLRPIIDHNGEARIDWEFLATVIAMSRYVLHWRKTLAYSSSFGSIGREIHVNARTPLFPVSNKIKTELRNQKQQVTHRLSSANDEANRTK